LSDNYQDDNVVVEFKDVIKKYPNGAMALNNINLKIKKGEFVFLVGPSGSGKSSLLKLILKEEDPSFGKVIVNGCNISTLKKKFIPHFRRTLGVVFQNFRLLPKKTVYGNVELAMQIVNASPKQIRRRIPTVLSLVGLSKKSSRYPNQLSGGEQQKVALARALVNEPVVLIADEPTGNLDPDNSRDILTLLNDICSRGTTVIVATHEMGIVKQMKKRVIQIESGAIVKDYPADTFG